MMVARKQLAQTGRGFHGRIDIVTIFSQSVRGFLLNLSLEGYRAARKLLYIHEQPPTTSNQRNNCIIGFKVCCNNIVRKYRNGVLRDSGSYYFRMPILKCYMQPACLSEIFNIGIIGNVAWSNFDRAKSDYIVLKSLYQLRPLAVVVAHYVKSLTLLLFFGSARGSECERTCSNGQQAANHAPENAAPEGKCAIVSRGDRTADGDDDNYCSREQQRGQCHEIGSERHPFHISTLPVRLPVVERVAA